jgi:hypothetical protein
MQAPFPRRTRTTMMTTMMTSDGCSDVRGPNVFDLQCLPGVFWARCWLRQHNVIHQVLCTPVSYISAWFLLNANLYSYFPRHRFKRAKLNFTDVRLRNFFREGSTKVCDFGYNVSSFQRLLKPPMQQPRHSSEHLFPPATRKNRNKIEIVYLSFFLGRSWLV